MIDQRTSRQETGTVIPEPRTPAGFVIDSLPADDVHTRRLWLRRLSTVVATMIFTVVQAWAIVAVLVNLQADGVTRVALACVLAGATMAVISAWQEVRAVSSANRREQDQE